MRIKKIVFYLIHLNPIKKLIYIIKYILFDHNVESYMV